MKNLKRFDVKGKKYIETPSKYYFVDIGIRNSLINFRQLEKTHINKKEQELQSLLNVGDNFNKIIIVYNHFIKWKDDNGIIYMSIYDFLLNENSLKEA